MKIYVTVGVLLMGLTTLPALAVTPAPISHMVVDTPASGLIPVRAETNDQTSTMGRHHHRHHRHHGQRHHGRHQGQMHTDQQPMGTPSTPQR